MLQKILFLSFSLFLVSCSSIKRPEGFICTLDSKHERNLCMDLVKDFSKDGELLPDAKWKIREGQALSSLDKHTNFDPDTWANVSTYIRQLRSEYENLKKECN